MLGASRTCCRKPLAMICMAEPSTLERYQKNALILYHDGMLQNKSD